MAKDLTIGFDYNSLPDEDLKGELLYHANQINVARRDLLIVAVQTIGEHLDAAHERLVTAGCKGQFGKWVDEEFQFSVDTAYNYMYGFRYLSELPNGSAIRLQLSAAYRLGKSDVPKSAKKEVAKLLERGRVTKQQADEIIAKHNGKPPARGEGGHDAPRGASAPPPTAEVPLVVDEAIEGELCPNCEENEVWVHDPAKDCYACRRCGHPRGEPVGDRDESTKAWKPPKQDEPPKKPTKAAAIKGIRDTLQEVYRHALDDVAPEYGLSKNFVGRAAYTGNVWHVLDELQKDLRNWK